MEKMGSTDGVGKNTENENKGDFAAVERTGF